MRTDVSLLVLRAVSGGLLAGHGAQKLFGSFSGPGRHGTAKMMGSLGLKPEPYWGMMAGAAEFGGGVLTALGLLSPVGPISEIAAMSMAAGTVHRGKPIWVTSGGAELPAINIAAALSLLIAGPGSLSLDSALGVRLPTWLVAGIGLAAAGLVGAGMRMHLQAQQPATQQSAPSSPAEQRPLSATA